MRELKINTGGKYQLNDLVRVAGRVNNKKRPYLYVNPLQGKHLPVNPKEVYHLCFAMANKLLQEFNNEKLLLIGFAETATALGLWTASLIPDRAVYCTQTTREHCRGREFITFSECHSHAPNQRLYTDGWDEVLPTIDRIVFVEDEVTTGNTIMNARSQICRRFPEYKGSFAVISVLNSMPTERLESLNKDNMPFFHIAHIPDDYGLQHMPSVEFVSAVADNTHYTDTERGLLDFYTPLCVHRPCFSAGEMYTDSRTLSHTERYNMRCRAFVEKTACSYSKILSTLSKTPGMRVLVLGTEEFMYPPLLLADYINSKYGIDTVFHATARSPIQASNKEGYPIKARYQLKSWYDETRDTYVYNLERYGAVFIVTDSRSITKPAYNSLTETLLCAGNRRIHTIIWEAF